MIGLAIRNGYNVKDDSWKPGIVMQVKPVVDGKVRININAWVTNPGTVHDKMARLVFEIMNGEEIVGTARLIIKAKQNWRGKPDETDEETKVVLPATALKRNPTTRMRITMTTADY